MWGSRQGEDRPRGATPDRSLHPAGVRCCDRTRRLEPCHRHRRRSARECGVIGWHGDSAPHPGPDRNPAQATGIESLQERFEATPETTTGTGTGELSGSYPTSQRHASPHQRDRQAPR